MKHLSQAEKRLPLCTSFYHIERLVSYFKTSQFHNYSFNSNVNNRHELYNLTSTSFCTTEKAQCLVLLRVDTVYNVYYLVQMLFNQIDLIRIGQNTILFLFQNKRLIIELQYFLTQYRRMIKRILHEMSYKSETLSENAM